MSIPIPPALRPALEQAGIPYESQAPLRDYTTLRIGGNAALMAHPQSVEQLLTTLQLWRAVGEGCAMLTVGRGSNLLAPDSGFSGLVICTRAVREVALMRMADGSARLYAGCGALVSHLSGSCADAAPALSGLEFACGIPGTLGGAVVMNAGAYGGAVSDVLSGSRYFDPTDGTIHTLTADEHHFAYRHSIYQAHPEWILLDAELHLQPGDADTIRATMEQHLAARRQSQPLDRPNAGSTFRRLAEPGVYVGKLIEDCGLKGYTIGGAQVSEKHAGFIINRGDATAADVRHLIRHIRTCVRERFGIGLECELCILPDEREDGTATTEAAREGGTP